jgi:uncharacterized protein (TIGR03067 family)
MSTTLMLAMTFGAPALKDKPAAKPSIVGEWQVESRFGGGARTDDQNIWMFSAGGVADIRDRTRAIVMSNLTYSSAADKGANAIDFMESQPQGPALLRRAIFKFEGDVLTICFTTQDAPRPSSFDTSNAGYTVISFKRVKK